jgi:hypothetical protein
MATKKPDRDEYPDPSLEDFLRAVRKAAAADDWRHFGCGRYTAHRCYTEHQPDAKPGDKHVAIRVTACERDIVADIPEQQADEFLATFEEVTA